MTQTRTPPTIVAAIIALCLVALLALVEALDSTARLLNPQILPFGVTVAAVALFCAVGCWRGWIPGLIMSVLVGALVTLGGIVTLESDNFLVRLASQNYALFSIALGVAVIGLVVVPRSSREHFFTER